ncbi:hypothetical protein GE061_014350 [Apolygus lucorum]|uniref:Uncharacterized protein n=1 Tax=Apolygus lucorum TaxID=248454 RepID=A0A6A4K8Y3_APOLU|nr:hypothetical protein GE061_014350 [Apolygus lucorum]
MTSRFISRYAAFWSSGHGCLSSKCFHRPLGHSAKHEGLKGANCDLHDTKIAENGAINEVSKGTVEGLLKKIRGKEAIKHFFGEKVAEKEAIKEVSKGAIKGRIGKKIDAFFAWYGQLTGMDDVRLMQNRVIEAQDTFVLAQEKRRNVSLELILVHQKLNQFNAELNSISREEERYLQLLQEEFRTLQAEKRIKLRLMVCERHERDSFSVLALELKASHEKERSYMQRSKYLNVIWCVIGMVTSCIGSWAWNKDINKRFKTIEHKIAAIATQNNKSKENYWTNKLYMIPGVSMLTSATGWILSRIF